jgi:rubrerythrin
MPALDASEIYKFAIKIEENGEKFYRHAAEACGTDEETRKIFAHLAEEEVDHKKVFEDMLKRVPKADQREKFPGEYGEYLSAYTDNLIFAKETGDDPWCTVVDTESALDFGIRRELDSILYYQEAKEMVGEDEKPFVEKIVEEERKHFMRLTALKKKIKP